MQIVPLYDIKTHIVDLFILYFVHAFKFYNNYFGFQIDFFFINSYLF